MNIELSKRTYRRRVWRTVLLCEPGTESVDWKVRPIDLDPGPLYRKKATFFREQENDIFFFTFPLFPLFCRSFHAFSATFRLATLTGWGNPPESFSFRLEIHVHLSTQWISLSENLKTNPRCCLLYFRRHCRSRWSWHCGTKWIVRKLSCVQ